MRNGGLFFAGAAFGGLLGAGAGLVESLFGYGDTVHRVAFLVGANGLLGFAGGLAVAALVSFLPAARASNPPRALAVLGGLLVAAPLALAFGLFANRVLLRGANFLSPASLALDLLAIALAAAGGVLFARFVRRRASSGLPSTRALALAAAATLAIWGAAIAGSRSRSAPSPIDPARPPIVLISMDTLRPDGLSIGGDPRGTSPQIDRLVRQGTFFLETVTASPGSAASHAALFTSRYPVSNGVHANFTILPPDVETLAERLRARGYFNAAFLTNTFLGRRFGFDQGFDLFLESGAVERGRGASLLVNARSLAIVQVIERALLRVHPGYDPSFEAALSFLDEDREPLFLFLHFMDAHSPYVPPHPYGPRFGANRDGNPGAAAAHGRPAPKRNLFGWRPSEEAYAGEIRFLDSKITRLVRELETRGILDRAIVVLTSDHGENLLDHEPNFTHGSTLYDSTLRVLWAMRGPGIRAGEVRAELVENVDVVPTLAALLGSPASSDWEGLPRLGAGAEASRGRPAFAVAQMDRDFAFRTSREKIVVHEEGTVDRYDLAADPGERSPQTVPREEAEIQRARIAEWMRSYATELYTNAPRAVRPDELSPEVVEKLRTLGYIE